MQAGTTLAHLRKSKEASVAGLEGVRGRVKKTRSEIMGHGLYRAEPMGHIEGFGM